ncbi:sigma-70 family RNA polymerase sigma factor [Ligilactobacillus murinus]|uniref:sigma-70 family RNA polymerase sigma factor n=1 Tax=Ligilactobacillus murinus TaxID=1622 RepID=UPI0013BDA714|nr:sigma-70 family RNA polymerase sigma factor [Ligilactobacillus murinus]NEF85717.1 sigma-70 family RNA polymerase sigma factor [Ligilactobacillus murinus]NEF94789.1 sigma-70 family RNA polymerase sigma factor [Ligilactobacillus murinus]NEF97027.1 sigma-70 family RNA polymerase sigma factor [Ligilactobacillus murinus]NEG03827.1 sigma-70 family RNA polymerase sigma factor [Ligilactobacillus murinus]NEG06050.1 sigma-70 family RNA polymerase sigma factor [Ligilactobacillus murinus]
MYEKGFAYLLQGEHEKVIYGVLKHLHVSRQDPDYEDLVVEGQIAFAQAYCAYCQAHDSVTEEAVMPYLYQKIKWRLLDLLRKQTRTKQRECGLPENADELWIVANCQNDDVIIRDLLERLWNLCTPKERKFLELQLYSNLNLVKTAKMLEISRKTVYNYKRSILRKLDSL